MTIILSLFFTFFAEARFELLRSNDIINSRAQVFSTQTTDQISERTQSVYKLSGTGRMALIKQTIERDSTLVPGIDQNGFSRAKVINKNGKAFLSLETMIDADITEIYVRLLLGKFNGPFHLIFHESLELELDANAESIGKLARGESVTLPLMESANLALAQSMARNLVATTDSIVEALHVDARKRGGRLNYEPTELLELTVNSNGGVEIDSGNIRLLSPRIEVHTETRIDSSF